MQTEEETMHPDPITITRVESHDELHHQYSGQSKPQPCHIEFDPESRTLHAASSPEVGSGIPMRLYHCRVVRWKIPTLTADAANALMEEISPLCERIAAGYSVRWNGHNHIGQLDDDATEADEEISAICDRDWSEAERVNVWDAFDYFSQTKPSDLGVVASTTDEEAQKISATEEENAAKEGITLTGAYRAIIAMRDRLADDDADADDLMF